VSGAIAVKQHFVHSSGNISIINSSAGKNGGALLLSSSGVGTTWLLPAEDQEGSQKRSFERRCVDVSGRVLLAVFPFPHVSREQDGSLNFSLLLNMILI